MFFLGILKELTDNVNILISTATLQKKEVISNTSPGKYLFSGVLYLRSPYINNILSILKFYLNVKREDL